MADPSDESVANGASSEPRLAHGRSPYRVVATVAIVLLVLLAVVWLLVAARQRDEVRVWFDARPVECLDGVPTVEDLELDFDPVYVHVLAVSPELDCWLRVHVENRGRLTATVRGLELPMHGPGTGGGIRARELSPLALSPQAEDETGWPALDAVYRFDYRLEPDTRLELRIGLEHQPNGCMSPDTTAWITDAPAVEVSVSACAGREHPQAWRSPSAERRRRAAMCADPRAADSAGPFEMPPAEATGYALTQHDDDHHDGGCAGQGP